jgi:hypothetical protein
MSERFAETSGRAGRRLLILETEYGARGDMPLSLAGVVRRGRRGEEASLTERLGAAAAGDHDAGNYV